MLIKGILVKHKKHICDIRLMYVKKILQTENIKLD